MLIGVDEVGRGALVGDLVVCAAAFADEGTEKRLLEKGCELLDSKAFGTRARREKAYELLLGDEGVIYGIARRSPAEIQSEGIHNAVLSAMSEAAMIVTKTSSGDHQFRFDGKFRPADFQGENSEAVVKGDQKVPEISAASIIAKVMRDREMVALGEAHPAYGFEKHSGYGTKQHVNAIRELGLISEHRNWAEKFLENV